MEHGFGVAQWNIVLFSDRLKERTLCLQVTYLSSRVSLFIFGCHATFPFQYCSLEVTEVSRMFAKAVI